MATPLFMGIRYAGAAARAAPLSGKTKTIGEVLQQPPGKIVSEGCLVALNFRAFRAVMMMKAEGNGREHIAMDAPFFGGAFSRF